MKVIRKTIQTTVYKYTVNENGKDYSFIDMVEGAPTLFALTKRLHREHDSKELNRVVTNVEIDSIEVNRYEMSVKDFIENAELIQTID